MTSTADRHQHYSTSAPPPPPPPPLRPFLPTHHHHRVPEESRATTPTNRHYIHIPNCRRVINGIEGCDIYTDSSDDDDDDDNDYQSSSSSSSQNENVGYDLVDVDLIFDFAGAFGELPASDFEPTIGRAWALERHGGNPSSRYYVCRNFAFSQCTRGSQCNFLHPQDIELAKSVADGQSRAAVMMGRQRLADNAAKRERERRQQIEREI